MKTDELVEVRVLVPAEKAARIYELATRLLMGQEDLPSTVDFTPVREWTAADVELLRELWETIPESGQWLINYIRAAEDGTVTAEGLGVGRNALAGQLAWPGRRCRALGKEPLVWSERARDVNFYRMKPEIRELLGKVLGE